MPRRRAIVVGVTDYANAELTNLLYSSNDASRFAKALVDHAQFDRKDVALFHDGPPDPAGPDVRQPHFSDIWSRLRDLAGECEPSDILVFFFAGHGGEISSEPYLLTNDTRRNSIDKTALDVHTINETMKAAKAQHKLRFFDACRSPVGGTRDGLLRPMTKGFESALSAGGEASVTFSACSSGQFAIEHPDWQHGLFSYYLCQGIEGFAAADGQIITIERLVDYVKLSVANECRHRSLTQTPQLFGSMTGSLILVPERTAKPAAPISEPKAGPLDRVGSFLSQLRSSQDELLRDARLTSQSDQQKLQEFVFRRVFEELIELAREHFQLEGGAPGHASSTDRILWSWIPRTLASPRMGEQMDGTSAQGQRFTLTPKSETYAGALLSVAIVRFTYFCRLYFRVSPNVPNASLAPNIKPPQLFDYLTVFPSAFCDEAKLEGAITYILGTFGDALQSWADQYAAAVRALFDQERSHANPIH